MLSLFVAGMPRPQGSMRAFVVAGRARLTHAKRDDLAVWRGVVSQAALYCWGDAPPLDEPVSVGLDFYLPRPSSASPRRRPHPDRRPDLDKLARAVLDSLIGIVVVDDARVVELVARKHYADAGPIGARIYCAPMPDPGPGSDRALNGSVEGGVQRVPGAVGASQTPGAGVAPRRHRANTSALLDTVLTLHDEGGIKRVMHELGYTERHARRLLSAAREDGT